MPSGAPAWLGGGGPGGAGLTGAGAAGASARQPLPSRPSVASPLLLVGAVAYLGPTAPAQPEPRARPCSGRRVRAQLLGSRCCRKRAACLEAWQ